VTDLCLPWKQSGRQNEVISGLLQVKDVTRTPESSAKSLIQVVAIFIRTDFGSFYPEIGSGI
jgi:hypothetical protein